MDSTLVDPTLVAKNNSNGTSWERHMYSYQRGKFENTQHVQDK